MAVPEQCKICEKDLTDKPRIEIISKYDTWDSDFEWESYGTEIIAYICSRECMLAYALDILIYNEKELKKLVFETDDEIIQAKIKRKPKT